MEYEANVLYCDNLNFVKSDRDFKVIPLLALFLSWWSLIKADLLFSSVVLVLINVVLASGWALRDVRILILLNTLPLPLPYIIMAIIILIIILIS